MAEDTKSPEPTSVAAASPPAAPVVVPEAEKPITSDKDVSVPEAEKPETETKTTDVDVDDDDKKITQQVSFKEETNVVADLPEFQRKALDELKKLILEACAKRQFSAPPPPKEVEKSAEEVAEKKEEEKTPPPPPAEVTAVEEVSPPATTTASTVQDPPKSVEAVVETKAPPTTEVAPPKTEVATKSKEEVVEKTVEAIKETIVEVAATTVEAAKEAATAVTSAVAATVVTDEPPTKEAEAVAEEAVEPEEVSIYGIPLLADERSDVILLKFLRAREFKVKEAFTMIRNTVRWRKEFGVDEVLEEDLGNEYEKVLFTHGVDKEGRVVCYNVFGEFQNKEFYQNTFSDAEKRNKFFKWLIQFIERITRGLDFSPKGINSIVLVNDLKNFPGFGYGKRDASKIIDKFLLILQDNYPEFVAKQLCINTSWWYVAYYWIYLTVFTPRSKSKFVFASPSKTPDTLFKYIAPEHVPVQYGGHSKTGENVFSPADSVTEVTIKPNTKHPLEFAFSEATELVWELRVIGWDVNYGAEFLPEKEGAYTLNISKPKKVSSTDEPVISDSFKVTEAGKVVITIDNQSSKKKKLLYRSKVKASV